MGTLSLFDIHGSSSGRSGVAYASGLHDRSPAYGNVMKMPESVRCTYMEQYLSFNTDEARQRASEKM